jgi:hypothetical protein
MERPKARPKARLMAQPQGPTRREGVNGALTISVLTPLTIGRRSVPQGLRKPHAFGDDLSSVLNFNGKSVRAWP